MAQGGAQLDYHILQDLKQRFPEIPEGVVSQCLLQNNNNPDLCYHLLAQESNRYLYGEFHHSPEEARMNRNHMLHINLGYPDTGGKANGGGGAGGVGRSLVHSSSDGHIEPQRPNFPEPLSAPAAMVPTQAYNPFMMSDPGRPANTPTPPPPPAAPPAAAPGMSSPVQRYTINPLTVTLSQNLPNAPQALHIPPGHYANNSTLYIRPSPSQSPQPAPWPSSGPQPAYRHQQQQQSPYGTPTYGSPYSSPQHQPQPPPPPPPQQQQQQQQQPPQQYVFLPISSPNMPYHHHQQQQQQHQQQQQQQQPPPIYRPALPKSSLKNQIEITLEGPRPRSNSPVHAQQGSMYMASSPSPGSPSRGVGQGGPGAAAAFHPGMYLQHQGPPRPRPASSPQPPQAGGYTFKIKVSPGGHRPQASSPPAESLLNLVDQGGHSAAPAPILPISALPGNVASQSQHMPRRSSSGSDDYAYTQALLLHQRARMERLLKELLLERCKLDQLKSDVNNMEYDALQRRFRRVNSSNLVPGPDEMKRLLNVNRKLKIDIDCTLKETDQLRTLGKFDPKVIANFYDSIQPGPAVPPKPGKKAGEKAPKPTPAPGAQRDEDFEGAQWNCESCTFLNHPALNRCEQCEMPRYN